MRTLVVMPTYNEVENLSGMVKRVHAANPEVHLLVVDDNSPDRTGQLADDLAASDERVHVLHRPGKAGLGAAYRAGFSWGIEHGYDVLVEMDADGSHQPEQLPNLLAQIGNYDVVLGSRWVRGGSVVNWPLSRKILSVGGNVYARLLLGMRIHDATGGFRVFTRNAIEQMNLLNGDSQGYVFQVDSSYRATRQKLRVREVPIEFVERVAGVSKMSGNIVLEAMLEVTRWAIAYRVLGRPFR